VVSVGRRPVVEVRVSQLVPVTSAVQNGEISSSAFLNSVVVALVLRNLSKRDL
jgi:hypothetical protein